MSRGMQLWRAGLCVLALTLAGSAGSWAQKAAVPSRVVQAVDDTRTVTLKGNVHPLARAMYDRGALGDSQPMTHMLLLLQRSQEQELGLQQLLDAQQTKGTASYHAWVTPDQFGKQFGPSDGDVQAVTDWLTRQGFQIAKLYTGRSVIEFSGNVAQVRNAFHTEMHRYVVNGEEHFANASDPAIPAALAPVVAGVAALNNFPKHSHLHRVGSFQKDLATGQVKPLFTYTDSNGTFYGVGPADFAKIYNIPTGTANGSGQAIAIVGQSNINTQDVCDFRSMFGLTPNCPTYTDPTSGLFKVVLNGPDPGLVAGDEGESDLDVEWAGAVAPAAQIFFVTSQSTISNLTQVTAGIDLSALYIIDNNLAPVMSESYGLCESALGSTQNAFYNAMWEQAAAEGITVVISAGDNGPAGCDPAAPPADQNAASQGIAVSGIASTPYNVAVGGTDFDQFNNPSNYWSSANSTPTQLSALGYIAEVPWSDSLCAANYPAPCTSVDPNGGDISAGSGGPSAVYPKPAWQQGGITPNDNFRDIPDVSLFASNGYNLSFYIVCQSDANPGNARCDLSTSPTSGMHNFSGVGGTSGATPTFAAIIALVNQGQVGPQNSTPRQGNANFVLYNLASKENFANCNSSSFTNPTSETIPAGCSFYDITKGNNGVACVASKPNCSNQTGVGYGLVVSGVTVDHGTPAFQAVTGYDLATGLGSINVGNLLTNWSTATRTSTTATLSSPSNLSVTSGQPFSVQISVTPAGATGNVSLVALASDGTTILGSVAANNSSVPFTLSGGSATVSTNLLPPGTAFIEGYYGGDVTHGASTSTPLALAVNGANQPSKTTLSWVSFNASNNPVLSTSSQSVTYGSPYILQIAVTNSNGTPCTTNYVSTVTTPCPTGTITLKDNGNALNDYPNGPNSNATNVAKLNNQGIAEDQPIQLSPGSHSIVASYAGDPNYQASTSNTLSVTVSKATTSMNLSSSLGSVLPGTSVTLTAFIITTSNGAGPTGSVQFANSGTSIGTVNCVPTSGAANITPPSGITAGTAYCTATLTSAISGLYPPPGNGPRGPGMPTAPIIVALMSAALFALGWRWMPQPRRRAYAYAGLLAFALLAVGIAGCGGGSGSSGGGLRTISAAYPGDANYTAAAGTVQITVQ